MGRTFGMSARKRAFTLVEVMTVTSIVAILTLVAAPLYTQNVVSAIMSEGIAGAGTIRSQLRCYMSAHGSYVGASFSGASNTINIGAADLEGKYFAQSDYLLTNVSSSRYTILVARPSKSKRADLPTYSMDQDGSEHGTFFSGM